MRSESKVIRRPWHAGWRCWARRAPTISRKRCTKTAAPSTLSRLPSDAPCPQHKINLAAVFRRRLAVPPSRGPRRCYRPARLERYIQLHLAVRSNIRLGRISSALSQLAWTHDYETLIWASKARGARHTFNYDLINGPDPGSQMSSVWRIPTVSKREKVHGYHPTQKPLRVVRRALLASTLEGDLVFDPFCGSGTTAVAAKELTRFFVGAELEEEFAELAGRRIRATVRASVLRKISERFRTKA